MYFLSEISSSLQSVRRSYEKLYKAIKSKDIFVGKKEALRSLQNLVKI